MVVALLTPLSISGLHSVLRINPDDLERIANSAGRYYQPFDRRRVKGQGKWRHIDNPTGVLPGLQARILSGVLSRRDPPVTMFGGVKGFSVRDNVEHHTGHAVLVTIDLRDCFARTSYRRVYQVYCDLLGCTPDAARLLTKLTTFQGRVPQGACTSSKLVNLTLIDLHEALAALAAERGLDMSFYVDDIALSGPRAADVIEPAIRIIQLHGHAVRHRKIQILPLSRPQPLNGALANAPNALGRKRRDELRHRIFELRDQSDPLDHALRSLWGQIHHARWVSPVQGQALVDLALRSLPKTGVNGLKPRSDETRPCSRRHRHRFSPSPVGRDAEQSQC